MSRRRLPLLEAEPAARPRRGRLAFVSLGCPKNTVDSERMLGRLLQDGFTLQADIDGADVVVVNTCGFIEAARQESLAVIREMVERKQAGQVGAVVVAGCLAERWGERLFEEVPGIDQVLGVFGREEIVAAVERALEQQQEQRAVFRPANVRLSDDTARLRITPRHYAYLKISEGCNRLCTYCAIPKMRGRHVSKPMEAVLREARELAADGVRELNLVAQDLTYYGVDLYGAPRLAELLRRLDREADGIVWIRLLYAYPEFISDELLDVAASSARIVPYLDLPLQHINDRILRRMLRRVDRRTTEALLERIRRRWPGVVLRTTFIVGFPGETDAEFEELRQFVAEFRFERLGVFAYSLEPDTPAARLDGHLPEEVKQARLAALMETQQAVAFAWSRQQVGREWTVLVDRPDPHSPRRWLGRTSADAPEIDGLVRLKGQGLRPGDLVPVRIVAADGYDLKAEPLGPPQ